MTRIGVVVLFFGVAFLLKYFAEHFTLPIAARLLAVAVAGVALTVVGRRVARTRPAYGWSLQGAGMGVLYLTAYAAFREFALIGAGPALVLLAIASAATVWLAVIADSQALAGLALIGAFLAPILTGSDRDPLPLFAYFTVVNAVVLVSAWWRQWPAVTMIGAAFTFALASWWGEQYYRPANFAIVEPFLVLFFGAYVTMAVAHSRKPTEGPRAKLLEGLLVFGVPIVAFALQAALVADTRYGAAVSALVLALVYGTLAWVMRSRADAASRLERSFALLAAVFASIAIPFAFDNQVTAALWLIEGALVYWVGVQQRAAWTRALAYALQVAAAGMFLMEMPARNAVIFANSFFIGAMTVALAGLATAWMADRHADRLVPRERSTPPLALGWGALWFIGAGSAEISRQLLRADQPHAVLAWITFTAFVALGAAAALAWPRVLAVVIALPIAMLFVMLRDFASARTTLTHAGFVAWPLAWFAIFLTLTAIDRLRPRSAVSAPTPSWRDTAHGIAAFMLTAQTAWELSEWTGRVTADDTVWLACAAVLPAIVYLGIACTASFLKLPLVRDHAPSYTRAAAGPIAVLLALWVLLVNLLSPGEPFPLPYIPVLNPLEIELVLALLLLFRWSSQHARIDERSRHALLGAGVFACVNGALLRVAHHWGHIPWDLPDLLASRPLQAALTLAWTVMGAALMYMAARRSLRTLWMVGAALLALVVLKLFVIDLSALSGLPRVVAFLGVGVLLLAIGYVSPLPPSPAAASPTAREPDA